MTESFHWSRLRQGSTECPKLDKAFPRFNRLHCCPSGDIKQCSKQWTSNNMNEWLWVSLSDSECWPYRALGHPGTLESCAALGPIQSHPGPTPQGDVIGTNRTNRTNDWPPRAARCRLAFAACGGRLDSAACSIQRSVASANSLNSQITCSMKNM